MLPWGGTTLWMLHDEDHVRVQRDPVHLRYHSGGFRVAGCSCELPVL
jgi:hypothetical protein